MSTGKLIKLNTRTINRSMATLTRATNPRHIEVAHSRIDVAETNVRLLNEALAAD